MSGSARISNTLSKKTEAQISFFSISKVLSCRSYHEVSGHLRILGLFESNGNIRELRRLNPVSDLW